MELTAADLQGLEAPPGSWFYAGQAEEVAAGAPLGLELAGRELVLFRGQAGLSALGARCPHMGVHLGQGRVVSGRLRCPYHAWEFAGDGRCARVPGLETPPDFAELPRYPLVVRQGSVFVSLAPEPAFPLPFFSDLGEEALVAGRPFRLEAPCPWWLVGANGFDVQHFQNVHGRTPQGPAAVDDPHPLARRVVHRLRISGEALQDRVSRRLWGEEAELSFTSWGGNVIVGVMRIGRFTSRLIVFVQALGASRCRIDFVVHRPRRGGAGRLWTALELTLLRQVSRRFFRHEADSLGAVRLDPARLVASDAVLRDYLEWLVAAVGPAARAGA